MKQKRQALKLDAFFVMISELITTALAASLLFNSPLNTVNPVKDIFPIDSSLSGQLVSWKFLASETLDLSNRYSVPKISEGFKQNILIAVNYFQNDNRQGLVLQPGEVFAFHKNILPEFRKYQIVTQQSGFLKEDGYLTVAGLQGNGVCHLASLMNWVAREAGLEVTAEVNHDFAAIPGIDRKYGTSIYYLPGGGSSTERQNLYIRNNKDYPVEFSFWLEGDRLRFSIKSQS